MKLLFHLSGSKFHLKNRHTKTQIKIQIYCSYSHTFTNSESSSNKCSSTSTSISRNIFTSRHNVNHNYKCSFSVNIILDFDYLDWHIKVSGNIYHCDHALVPLMDCSIGTKQLSNNMLDEIKKTH